MRRNPVNFDSALETLKEERPSTETRRKARESLDARHPRPFLVPRLALGALAIAAIIVFYPRQKAAAAWGWAVKSSSDVPIVHRVERDRSGTIICEIWQDGKKRAEVMRDKHGKLVCEMRNDEHRLFDYFDFQSTRSKNPNAVTPGIVTDVSQRFLDISRYGADLISDLLDRKDVVILSQKEGQDASGPVTVYQLTMKEPHAETLTVDVETATGRIKRVVSRPSGTIAIVEYPKSIDPSVFEPRPQVAKGVRVYDLQEEESRAKERLATSLGDKGGVKLRLVLLDARGTLWVLWTGAPPDGRLSKPFLASGLRLGQPFGPAAFTSGFKKDPFSQECPAIGQRLEGMGREALTRVGDRIDVEVPGPNGKVAFRNVSVLRIREIHDLGRLLGLFRAKGIP
ncbi:MAG TPA: hypothetical protein VG820_01020 [Fimbriimonadaceae bacterium]|nr:hypothetical protein [Fimbriimonadaceae bacterium]